MRKKKTKQPKRTKAKRVKISLKKIKKLVKKLDRQKLSRKFRETAKILASVVLIFSLVGFPITGKTSAYFSDEETSSENSFSASMLDFDLFNNSYESQIGPEALGEKTYASIAMPVDGSLDMQYNLSNAITSDASGLCGKLTVEAKQNGVTQYSGLLSGLEAPTSTDFGSWEFRFDMPVGTLAGHGDICNIDAVFSAWRADTVLPEDSGYSDEERTSFSFTARMVVLNEIFARPNGGTAPKDKEYIELYNNGNTPIETLGWQISEISGVTETFYPIVASGAVSGQVMPYNGASTIIPAGGFLVLQFGGGSAHLNDTGDTVKLYDASTVLLDSHTYPGIAAGKAVVRFPDGIGFWVDPEPSPGTTNMISLEDLRMAGFSDEMIQEVLKLALLTNATWSTESEKPKEEEIPLVVETPVELVTELITTESSPTTTEGGVGETPAVTDGEVQSATTTAETGEIAGTPEAIVESKEEAVVEEVKQEETPAVESAPTTEPEPQPEAEVEAEALEPEVSEPVAETAASEPEEASATVESTPEPESAPEAVASEPQA